MGVFWFEDDDDTPEMHRQKQNQTSINKLTIVPKKLWRSRAKSQTRVPTNNTCAWIPEGNCRWKTDNGRRVELTPTYLLSLSEVERLALQQMALSKLRAMNLNCKIEIPKVDCSQLQKIRRRTHLLRQKARSTAFDGREKKEKDIPSEHMFGVPLQQCIQNDRMLRHRGSINSLADDGISHSPSDHAINYSNHLGATSSSTLGNTLFVAPSETHTDNENQNENNESSELQVPSIVISCFQHLEEHGLHTLGLFRVTSSRRRVRQLREDLESGLIDQLNDSHNPHDVAQLLKEYFRDLPEPLLTRDLYSAFMIAQRQRENKQMDILRFLIYLLPIQNRDTLWALLSFLSKVAENSSDRRCKDGSWEYGNKMDSMNLATLFGPNILHMKDGKESEYAVEKAYRPEEYNDIILIVQKLIDNYEKLFMVTSDDLDSSYRRLLVEDPEALQELLMKHYILQIQYQSSKHLYPENKNCILIHEKTVERSRQKERTGVVLPVITISNDSNNIKKNNKTRTDVPDNDINEMMLGPPGFRDESPSLRRKSFPDEIVDRTLLVADINPSFSSTTFATTTNKNNLDRSYKEAVAPTNTEVRKWYYVKTGDADKADKFVRDKMEEPLPKERKYLLTPDDKCRIEKSASASSVAGNKHNHEKRDKSQKPNKNLSKGNYKQKETFLSSSKCDSNVRSRSTQRSSNRTITATSQCQPERWKRWEIIASEHSQV